MKYSISSKWFSFFLRFSSFIFSISIWILENAFWYLKNCKCNVDVTTKGHKWETYYGLDDDLIKYIRKIENQLQQKENIIKEVREYIENTKMFTNGDEKEFTLKETWYGKELLEILDKVGDEK